MANVGDRMKVLKLVEEGRITAEQGAEFLAKSDYRQQARVGSSFGRGGSSGRWLHIRVTDITTGHSKASVQIPVQLVDAGLKIGAQFVPDIKSVDLAKVMDAVRAGATGKVLDVNDDKEGEHTEISIE